MAYDREWDYMFSHVELVGVDVVTQEYGTKKYRFQFSDGVATERTERDVRNFGIRPRYDERHAAYRNRPDYQRAVDLHVHLNKVFPALTRTGWNPDKKTINIWIINEHYDAVMAEVKQFPGLDGWTFHPYRCYKEPEFTLFWPESSPG